jgi:pyruvate carboxylase subunit B
LGKAGKLPGKLDPEIIELAKKNKFEFFEGNPQDNYPDELPKFIQEMEKLGWERGQDDEELFEFAMHEKQYRDLKSGAAKERFDKELEAAIKEKYAKTDAPIVDIRTLKYPNAEPVVSTDSGIVLWELDFNEKSTEPAHGRHFKQFEMLCAIQTNFGVEPIGSFCNGRIVGVEKKQGEFVRKGEALAFIEKD